MWNFLRVTRTISKNSEACIIRTHENQSETFLVYKKVGQAEKSARGMPWHQEPKKDVTSCDKLRGGANNRRSGDFRMGKPGRAILCQRALNQIGVRGEPPELKHLSRARKRKKFDSVSSGERTRKRPNQWIYSLGLRTVKK